MEAPAEPPVLDRSNWGVWRIWELFQGSLKPGAHGIPMPSFYEFIKVCEWLDYQKSEIEELWGQIQVISTLIFKEKKDEANDKGGKEMK